METQDRAFLLACPDCGAASERVGPRILRCAAGHEHHREAGIWRVLPKAKVATYETFERNYRKVRREECWGADNADYYRNLPFHDLTGRWTDIWKVRAISWRTLERRVLPDIDSRSQRPRALDLGAGNCWLSYRLSLRDYDVMAIDLSVDELDGLGAHTQYPVAGTPAGGFMPLQASFDHLPLRNHQVDLVVFNASLHYSEDISASLRETLRVVAEGGTVVIMDTPLYRSHRSGEEMLRERHAACLTAGFLTPSALLSLTNELGIEWTILRPFYGLNWALRPLKNRLLGLREPMRFRLLVGRRKTP